MNPLENKSSKLCPLKVIGTHNSMSYLAPAKWWMKPLRIFAQCQNKTLEEQIQAGAECVDLRVYKSKHDGWCFAHGLVKYKGAKLIPILNKLAQQHPGIIIRLILERARNSEDKQDFSILCRYVNYVYPEINFIGGFHKRTWESLYEFELNDIEIHQHVGSMAEDARWYEKIIPCAYSRRLKEHAFKPGINLIKMASEKLKAFYKPTGLLIEVTHIRNGWYTDGIGIYGVECLNFNIK